MPYSRSRRRTWRWRRGAAPGRRLEWLTQSSDRDFVSSENLCRPDGTLGFCHPENPTLRCGLILTEKYIDVICAGAGGYNISMLDPPHSHGLHRYATNQHEVAFHHPTYIPQQGYISYLSRAREAMPFPYLILPPSNLKGSVGCRVGISPQCQQRNRHLLTRF